MGDDTGADPYVKGWHDCAETVAGLLDIMARDIMAGRRGLRERLLARLVAGAYRRAAKIARATTEVDRDC